MAMGFYMQAFIYKTLLTRPRITAFSSDDGCRVLARLWFARDLRTTTRDREENMKKKPIVLCGPSGSGKSTLVKRLMQEHPDLFGFSVSHTTRQPRPGEVNGKDYNFIEREAMEKRIAAGEFLEHAEYNNNLYGTSKKAVQNITDIGKVCILDIDMQGVKSVKKTKMDCLFVFAKPPSINELENRLRKRGTETSETLERRLEIAKSELAYGAEPGNYNYTIINDDLEKAYQEFKEIISKEIVLLTTP